VLELLLQPPDLLRRRLEARMGELAALDQPERRLAQVVVRLPELALGLDILDALLRLRDGLVRNGLRLVEKPHLSLLDRSPPSIAAAAPLLAKRAASVREQTLGPELEPGDGPVRLRATAVPPAGDEPGGRPLVDLDWAIGGDRPVGVALPLGDDDRRPAQTFDVPQPAAGDGGEPERSAEEGESDRTSLRAP